MTDSYRLVVKVEAEPETRGPTGAELDAAQAQGRFIPFNRPDWSMYTVRDYSRAAGTYVEVENAGEVCNFDASQLTIDDGTSVQSWPLLMVNTTQSLRLELPRVDRPIVLLAVGGGNQEFDHWDAESSICLGQGARCEVPEPAADYEYTLYAKAVFRRKDPEDIRVGPFDGRQTRHGLTVDPPRKP